MVRVEDDHFIRRDGSFVPVAYSSAPVQLSGGIGAVVAFRDLTERLRLEASARMSEIERARAEELEASRARIAEAADAAVRQIERDLHDGAQQRLGAVLVRLEIVRNLLESEPKEAAEVLQRTQRELEDGLRELRELTRGIRPAILRERGLEAAIRALAIRAPIEVELLVDEVGQLPTAVDSTIYFVTAEALSNVARHSGASHATVSLKRLPHEIAVTIRDDGHGAIDERRGSGITGLRDRVEAAGGTFSASSTPGEGSVISARLPLEMPLPPR
jgi:signal transduction histidine kinase